MARSSTEQLVASTIESRENPDFPAHGVKTILPGIYDVACTRSQDNPSRHLRCGIKLSLKGGRVFA